MNIKNIFDNILSKIGKSAKSENKSFDEILLPNFEKSNDTILPSCQKNKTPNNYEAYFKNGNLYNVRPRNRFISLYEDRQTAYNARYIISDNKKYDLENAESIKSIKIPYFNEINGMPSVTADLSYIMKMKANSEDRCDLAVPLTYKAANLMIASPIGWSKKDYYQIIKHLWLLGEIKYADYLLEELNTRKVFEKTTKKNCFSDYYDESSPYFGSDLIESNDTNLVCSECAKYTKRIFSEFGLNIKYPKLPDYFKENKCEHQYCDISFVPVLDNVSVPSWNYTGELAEYCNRPFEDERSDEEKQTFEEHKQQRIKKEQSDKQYFNRDYWINEYRKHLEYQQIVNIIGDKAPKSYSGYMKMKNGNTSNYQKILKIAKENNIKIN